MIEATFRLNVPKDQSSSLQDLVSLTSHLAERFEQFLAEAGIEGTKVEKVALYQTNKAEAHGVVA